MPGLSGWLFHRISGRIELRHRPLWFVWQCGPWRYRNSTLLARHLFTRGIHGLHKCCGWVLCFYNDEQRHRCNERCTGLYFVSYWHLELYRRRIQSLYVCQMQCRLLCKYGRIDSVFTGSSWLQHRCCQWRKLPNGVCKRLLREHCWIDNLHYYASRYLRFLHHDFWCSC